MPPLSERPLKSFEIIWNPLKSFEILWNLLKSFEILWNLLKSVGILRNPLKSFEILGLGFPGELLRGILGSPGELLGLTWGSPRKRGSPNGFQNTKKFRMRSCRQKHGVRIWADGSPPQMLGPPGKLYLSLCIAPMLGKYNRKHEDCSDSGVVMAYGGGDGGRASEYCCVLWFLGTQWYL